MSDTLTYLSDDDVLEVRITKTPFNPSASGYGAKIPTRYMLKLAGKGRFHRVYAMCYGNGSSAYVLRGGVVHHLAISTEHRMTAYRNALDAGVKRPERELQPVRLDKLAPGDRFCFHYDGVASTLLEVGAPHYRWHDYQGGHRMVIPGFYDDRDHAWPYVFRTSEPETVVKAT